jgi:hypothetical protein
MQRGIAANRDEQAPEIANGLGSLAVDDIGCEGADLDAVE